MGKMRHVVGTATETVTIAHPQHDVNTEQTKLVSLTVESALAEVECVDGRLVSQQRRHMGGLVSRSSTTINAVAISDTENMCRHAAGLQPRHNEINQSDTHREG